MGMMDNMQDEAGDMADMGKDQMQARMHQLMDMNERGELDDQGRAELAKLREKMQ